MTLVTVGVSCGHFRGAVLVYAFNSDWVWGSNDHLSGVKVLDPFQA